MLHGKSKRGLRLHDTLNERWNYMLIRFTADVIPAGVDHLNVIEIIIWNLNGIQTVADLWQPFCVNCLRWPQWIREQFGILGQYFLVCFPFNKVLCNFLLWKIKLLLETTELGDQVRNRTLSVNLIDLAFEHLDHLDKLIILASLATLHQQLPFTQFFEIVPKLVVRERILLADVAIYNQ